LKFYGDLPERLTEERRSDLSEAVALLLVQRDEMIKDHNRMFGGR